MEISHFTLAQCGPLKCTLKLHFKFWPFLKSNWSVDFNFQVSVAIFIFKTLKTSSNIKWNLQCVISVQRKSALNIHVTFSFCSVYICVSQNINVSSTDAYRWVKPLSVNGYLYGLWLVPSCMGRERERERDGGRTDRRVEGCSTVRV